MYGTWPRERCGRGGRRRSTSVTRWMIWRRVMTMIGMVLVTSIKLRIKYIVPSIMVKATPWIDRRKGQIGTKDRVVPQVGIVDE
jgi:hypothetical protein